MHAARRPRSSPVCCPAARISISVIDTHAVGLLSRLPQYSHPSSILCSGPRHVPLAPPTLEQLASRSNPSLRMRRTSPPNSLKIIATSSTYSRNGKVQLCLCVVLTTTRPNSRIARRLHFEPIYSLSQVEQLT